MRAALLLLAVTMTAADAIAQRADTARYLALGDSYTIGEGVAPADRWPMQLARALRARGMAIADPQIIARTGWTTDELAAAIDSVGPRGPFDLVTLLIGVNNQYRGRPVDEYRAQFRDLLGRAIAFAGGDAGRVVVVSIPDWGVTPFNRRRDRATVAREIDAFNAAAQEITRASGVRWVDVTALSRQHPDEVVADGLHPDGRMYGRWVAEIAAAVGR